MTLLTAAKLLDAVSATPHACMGMGGGVGGEFYNNAPIVEHDVSAVSIGEECGGGEGKQGESNFPRSAVVTIL